MRFRLRPVPHSLGREPRIGPGVERTAPSSDRFGRGRRSSNGRHAASAGACGQEIVTAAQLAMVAGAVIRSAPVQTFVVAPGRNPTSVRPGSTARSTARRRGRRPPRGRGHRPSPPSGPARPRPASTPSAPGCVPGPARGAAPSRAPCPPRCGNACGPNLRRDCRSPSVIDRISRRWHQGCPGACASNPGHGPPVACSGRVDVASS